MEQNSGDSITVSKDMAYGIIVVLLAGALALSIFTQGFGIIKPSTPTVAVANITQPQQPQNPAQQPQQALTQLKVETGTLPPLGQANAPVTMVEFSDYQCPFCARLYYDALAQLKSNQIQSGKLKLYFRDLPLGFHKNAQPAAIAARCANAQGKFWQMHDKLFENQDVWSDAADPASDFKKYATAIGLDVSKFSTCYDNKEPANTIKEDMNAADLAGATGTPANFIIVPKSKMIEQKARSIHSSLAARYKDQQRGAPYISLFENSNEYIFFIPGAFPYDPFNQIISQVS